MSVQDPTPSGSQPEHDEDLPRWWLSVRGVPPFALTTGVDVTIGRGQDCDLCIYSSMLSREHAAIRWENGRPVLFDLDSLNGTFLGFDRLRRHGLQDGDVFRLGDINLRFAFSKRAPSPPPPPTLDTGEAATPDPFEPGSETRLYSRTATLQQRLFAYDELGWLRDQLGQAIGSITALAEVEFEPSRWFEANQGEPELLWRLLELGVFVPTKEAPDLSQLGDVREVVAVLQTTKRGRKLASALDGKRVVWNEMAALRYALRQGQLFQPLRSVARAYRPGAGLDEVDLERLIYELQQIYAADLSTTQMHRELRVLLEAGFLAPAGGARQRAWYPQEWASTKDVVLSARGRALLEGFRLEEDED